MKKSELIARLAQVAPSIAFDTLWEHDDDGAREFKELSRPGECFAGQRPGNWQCWQSEVTATIIVNGKLESRSAYLGGTWEKYGTHPEESNPEISGYFLQMAEEAMEELRSALSSEDTTRNHGARLALKEVDAALECLKQSREEWHAQPV